MSSVHLNSVIRLIYRKGNDDYSLESTAYIPDPSNPLKPIESTSLDVCMSYADKYRTGEIDGEIILKNDVKLYVDPSSLSVDPDVDDKMVKGSDTYTIKNIEIYKERDTVALYIMQLRK